jgi:hypothetical protein
MKTLGIPFFCVAYVLSHAAYAAPGDETSDPVLEKCDDLLGRFFEQVGKGESNKALNELLKDSALLRQSEALKTLADKAKDLDKKYGKYRGFDRIDAKRIGKDLILLRYLYKCDEFPVVWSVAVYRDFKRGDVEGNNWIIVSLRFDTDLDLLGL